MRRIFGAERAEVGVSDPVRDAEEAAKSLFLAAFQYSGLVGPAIKSANRRNRGLPLTAARVTRWREEDPVFAERVAYFEDQLRLDLEELAVKLAFGRPADPENGDPGVDPDPVMVRYLLPKLYPEKYSEKRTIKVGPGSGTATPFLPELKRPEIIDVEVTDG